LLRAQSIQCRPFSWSVSTTEIIVVGSCSRKVTVGTAVIPGVKTSQPGCTALLRAQSIQCRPLSWGVSTTEIIVVGSCSRKITIGTTVIPGVDASLDLLCCFVAVK
jgi:hypothetical protein